MFRRNLKGCRPLFLAALLGALSVFGCSHRPSDEEVAAAVEETVRREGVKYSLLKTTSQPPRTFSGPFAIMIAPPIEVETINAIRVVKRGRSYRGREAHEIGRELFEVQVFPVRVYLSGTVRVTKPWEFTPSLEDGQVLPFEGEMDFDVHFLPPDERKLYPDPGKWVANAAE